MIYNYDIYRPLEESFNHLKSPRSVHQLIDDNAEGYVWDRLSIGLDSVRNYMNRDDVRNILHVPLDRKWEECSSIQYTRLTQASQWIYDELRFNIRILHFGGSTDGQVPALGAVNWMNEQGWKITEAWRPWLREPDHLGGYW